MGLQLVTDTVLPDRGPRDPVHPIQYPLTPPADLGEPLTFAVEPPWKAFRSMRETAPVMWHPLDNKKLEGFWALTRYDDIRAASLDTGIWSSQMGGIMMAYANDARQHPKLHSASLNTMICLDAPHHMQLRREHMQFVRPDFVADLRRKVDQRVTHLLDGVERNGPRLDWVEHFSSRLPLFTLCEMLGVPEADRPQIRDWMDMLEMATYVLGTGDPSSIDPQLVMTFLTEVEAMFAYGRDILLARRANPTGDLLSAIANVEIDGERLPDEFLDGSWLLIIIAGNDTTRNSLSGGLRLLGRFPDEKAKVLTDRSLIPNMCHEIVRMVSPVMYMRRTALQETEIRGQMIAKGEKIVMWYGAGNRDPEVFPDPDRFIVTRENASKHIAFGTGPHLCMGQRIANMQLNAAFTQIFDRFPDIAWTGQQTILPNNFTHSIGSLEVDLGPA
ncbi:cytochrome P450 [uncultured Algimonas sp.]|uniref:cytochrome P450 n=1 Tax=uncultured Algimonas sp. TaxID=1547920 RepID=UPI0026177B25|nr:cytochrome P450 [uncultured Algimonas sp.]